VVDLLQCQGKQAEDDQHPGVGVTGPEELLLQVVGRDFPARDAEDEGAALGDRDDNGQQHPCGDLVTAVE
jgi:hypothetical protein